MFPVGLLPFPIDSVLISNILQSLLLINPSTLVLTGLFLVTFLSLKTMTAKLACLGIGMLVGSLVSYIMYKIEKKAEKQNKEKQSFLEYVDNSSVTLNNQTNSEEKELVLSKIFKK